MAHNPSSGKGVWAYSSSTLADKKPIKGALTSCTTVVNTLANNTSINSQTSHLMTLRKKSITGLINSKKPVNCQVPVQPCNRSASQPALQYHAKENKILLASTGRISQARTERLRPTLNP